MGRHDLVQEVDVAQRRGAHDHALRSGLQGRAHGAGIAQAAPVLDRHPGLGRDPAQVAERGRDALAGAVEIHHVEEARAGLHPGQGGRERIVVIHGLVLVAPAREPHRPAAADVDGRIEDHAGTPTRTKLRSSASPSREDFSGWNCAPMTFPRSAIETKRSP